MKKSLKVLLAVLLIITSIPFNVFAGSMSIKVFPDVGNHWAKAYIEKLTAMDIVHGYPDGTCRPDGTITRGEFSCLVSNTLDLDEKVAIKEAPTFADVRGNWAQGHIEALVDQNVINPKDYPNGFKTNGAITRMEITKMMVNAIGKADVAQRIGSNTGFVDDEEITAENKGYVIVAKNYSLIYGYPDNTFRADKNSTRAEAMALIVRMLDVLNPPPSGGSVHYPNAVVDFQVPEKTHVDKKVEFATRNQNVKGLTWSLKKQNEDKSMSNLDLVAALDGSLDEKGGSFMFKEKGNYELTASATNYGNSKFEFTKALMVYPVPRAEFTLDKYSYTDYSVNVLPAISELGDLDIVWTITKDGQQVDLSTCIEGTLNNEGGIIRFKDKGEYALTATITDETSRAFVYNSAIKIYPIPKVEFTLPQIAHTDETVSVSPELTQLGSHNIVWSITKDGEAADWKDYIDGELTNDGGTIRFKDKGEYVLTASITDEVGRDFVYNSSVKIYPIPKAVFTLPQNAHTDEVVSVLPEIIELGSLNIEWSLTKDGNPINVDTSLDGELTNNGGNIRFKNKGDYVLTATITDEIGRVFDYSSSIKIYPMPEAKFTLPENAHTDETVNVTPELTELGDLNIVWSVKKNGEPADWTACIDGKLVNEGGTIRFKDKGSYTLSATITDATGRDFSYTSDSLIYPIPEAKFALPESAHTDETVNVSPELTELGDRNIVWTVTKNGEAAEWETCVDGTLENSGGTIRFLDKGDFVLVATITDKTGRSFTHSSNIKIYPVSKAELTLPAFGHTDTTVEVAPTLTELGNLNIEWSLTKDGSPVSISACVEGALSNKGGAIRFKDKGSYTLTASITNEVGRTFVSSSTIKIYPVPKVEITLPTYAHTDTMVNVATKVSELGSLNIAWTAIKDNGTPVSYAALLDGNLTNLGGSVRFKEKGSYLLAATVTDEVGRAFTYKSGISVSPIPTVTFDLPQRIHIGSTANIATNPMEVGSLTVEWSLKKDGSAVNMSSFTTANLNKNGGSISFNATGNYILEAKITDSTGRVFTYSDSVEAYNNAPATPTASANVTRTISNGKFLVTLSASSIDSDGDAVSYEYSGKAADNYYAAGAYTVKVRAVDEHGASSAWKDIVFTVVNNAPSAPVITRSPNTNSVAPGTVVTIDATSTDPEGDAITYVWEGRTSRQATYPLGKNVVKVKAVDAAGAESPWSAIVFFVADEASGGGMTLTGPESTIIENGIDGATITEYTFTVPPVSGHSGSDYGRVRGYNKNTGAWEQIDIQYTSNGITMTGTLPAGKYSKLELYYYTNHTCMYNKSNITYTVKYFFQ